MTRFDSRAHLLILCKQIESTSKKMSRFLRIKLTPARKKMLYSPTRLTEAYRMVKDEGMAVRKASTLYGVPRTTLRDRLFNNVSVDCTRTGPETVFTLEEERRLCDHLKELAEVGYGYTRAEVVNLATDYAIHLQKRTTDRPLTLSWFYNFLSRWPELKVTKPSSLTELRAKCANEKSITSYFNELGRIMNKYDLINKPHNIYNIDEKGINTEYRPPNVVAGHNCKAQAIMAERSKTITVIGGGNAAGHQIPPFFVFPGARLVPELLHGKSPGADGVMTQSGWSNAEVFERYMKSHFLTFCQGRNETDTILVLYDGHRSHVSLGLIEWATQHNIVLFVLPPHTSHVLQPMDVGCFGPMQLVYNQECTKFVRSQHRVVSRFDVCALACKAYASALSPGNLHSAFRRAGIYPLLEGKVMCENLGQKIKPSTLYASTPSDEQGNVVVCSGAADEICKGLVVSSSSGESEVRGEGTKNAESELVSRSSGESEKVTEGVQNVEPVLVRRSIVESETVTKGAKDAEPECISGCIGESKKVEAAKSAEKDFFGNRSAVVCKKVAKKRRNVSNVIGGKALEGETVKNLEEYMAESNKKVKSQKPKPPKQQKRTKKAPKPKCNKPCVVSPKPGPSRVVSQHDSDSEASDSDRESVISESEKCCVCKKFYVNHNIYSTDLAITSWVQCIVCSHWVHLKYCTKLRVARKNTQFQCNCCM